MRDIDVRHALRHAMNRRHQGEPDTLIVEELGLCQGAARVDFAVINGSIHGYEIKSQRDTLSRLPAQAEVYSRALEFVSIVAAENHMQAITKAVPGWWGIWTVVRRHNEFAIEALRDAAPNPCINLFAMAQLLWREEALKILIQHGRSSRLLSKPRAELWRRLSVEFSVEELTRLVRECLKRRGEAWRSDLLQVSRDDSRPLCAKS